MNRIAAGDVSVSRRQLFRYGGLTALVGGSTLAPGVFGFLPSVASAAPAPTDLSSAVVVANGMWSSWVYPLAVNDKNLTWVGTIDNRGAVSVNRFSINSNTRVVLGQSPTVDDHNGPAIAFKADQADLVVFWVGHNDRKYIEYRRVNRSTLALGPTTRLDFSGRVAYVQVISYGNRLVALTRCPQGRWAFRCSEDFGRTWGAEGTFLQEDVNVNTKQYIALRPHPTRAGTYLFTAYTHPVSGTYRSIDAGLVDVSTGAVSGMDGIAVGNLFATRPANANDLKFVAGQNGPQIRLGQLNAAQTPPAGYRIRLLDTGFVNDAPAVAYAMWPDGDYLASQYGVSVYLDGWQQTGWNVASGAGIVGTRAIPHYYGGMAVGLNDGSFHSVRQIEDSGRWIAETWRMRADSWTADLVAELASTTGTQMMRPMVPAGNGHTDVLALNVRDYTSYTVYDSDVVRLYARPLGTTGSQVRLVASDTIQGFGLTPVSITATVDTADGRYPEGSIRFLSGETVVATVPLANAQATYVLKSTAAPGLKSVKAQFVPLDPSEQLPSVSDPIQITVVKPAATTIRMTASAPVQVVGRTSVTLTALATRADKTDVDGSIRFVSNGVVIATAKAVGGKATYTLKASAAPGTKSVTAVFVPADLRRLKGSTSGPVKVTVVRPAKSTTKLSASKARQVVGGTPATVTAVVAVATKAKPVGTVTFRSNGVAITTVKVVNGKATFTLKSTSTPKVHVFTATFSPTGPEVLSSTSNSTTVTVAR